MRLFDWFRKSMMPRKARALRPEASYRVAVDGDSISCTDPRGETSSVLLAELKRVVIRTTDEGPVSTDVFWVLTGSGRTCIVPQGATGEQALIDTLMKLPGFVFEQMIDAMGCTENREFECWRR